MCEYRTYLEDTACEPFPLLLFYWCINWIVVICALRYVTLCVRISYDFSGRFFFLSVFLSLLCLVATFCEQIFRFFRILIAIVVLKSHNSHHISRDKAHSTNLSKNIDIFFSFSFSQFPIRIIYSMRNMEWYNWLTILTQAKTREKQRKKLDTQSENVIRWSNRIDVALRITFKLSPEKFKRATQQKTAKNWKKKCSINIKGEICFYIYL